MTNVTTRGTGQSNLHARGPAYAAMQRCLHEQLKAAPRSTAARFFGLNPLYPQARDWYEGALGELEVAGILAHLGDEYTVLHAVPVGDGDTDIDHIVIGPPGIFTINTQSFGGQKVFVSGQSFMVDGRATDHLRNSTFEAKHAGELIRQASGGTVQVTPLIVVVGVDAIKFGPKPPIVTVLTASRLHAYLTRLPLTMRPPAVAYYVNAAEERSTWHSIANDHSDTLRHTQRFERLRQEVDAARTTRNLWRAVGAIAVLLLAAAFAVRLFL